MAFLIIILFLFIFSNSVCHVQFVHECYLFKVDPLFCQRIMLIRIYVFAWIIIFNMHRLHSCHVNKSITMIKVLLILCINAVFVFCFFFSDVLQHLLLLMMTCYKSLSMASAVHYIKDVFHIILFCLYNDWWQCEYEHSRFRTLSFVYNSNNIKWKYVFYYAMWGFLAYEVSRSECLLINMLILSNCNYFMQHLFIIHT